MIIFVVPEDGDSIFNTQIIQKVDCNRRIKYLRADNNRTVGFNLFPYEKIKPNSAGTLQSAERIEFCLTKMFVLCYIKSALSLKSANQRSSPSRTLPMRSVSAAEAGLPLPSRILTCETAPSVCTLMR